MIANDPGVTVDLPKVDPGGVFRWAGPDVDECRMGSLSWSPRGDGCWYPVDLRREPGLVEVARIRNGITETMSVVVADSPYPIQQLSVPQKMVDPPADQVERIRREGRRVNSLWHLGGPSAFDLPLHPPLSPLPTARSFGSRRVFNGQPSNPHSGADFSADIGTPVLASADGTVVIADDHYFAGNSVFIDHGDDFITMYFHLERIDVAEGQAVRRGEPIGTVGATGRVTGPHLHFGIRWHGARVDPAPLLADPESIPALHPTAPTR
jgi:murein DD-endopeptidase MepM/ murein hydrolase activator NlpD